MRLQFTSAIIALILGLGQVSKGSKLRNIIKMKPTKKQLKEFNQLEINEQEFYNKFGSGLYHYGIIEHRCAFCKLIFICTNQDENKLHIDCSYNHTCFGLSEPGILP